MSTNRGSQQQSASRSVGQPDSSHGAGGVVYQMITRSASGCIIGLPAGRPKLLAKSGRLASGPLTRNSGGLCGFDFDLQLQELRPGFLPPALRVGDEEALRRGQPGDLAIAFRGGKLGQPLLQGRVGDLQPAEIGDVLALGQLAVDRRVANLEAIELLDDFFTALLEALHVLLGPPILEIALRVVLPALVVEAVRHLMADGRAGAAVVAGVVRLQVKERRLQDARRERQFHCAADCNTRSRSAASCPIRWDRPAGRCARAGGAIRTPGRRGR